MIPVSFLPALHSLQLFPLLLSGILLFSPPPPPIPPSSQSPVVTAQTEVPTAHLQPMPSTTQHYRRHPRMKSVSEQGPALLGSMRMCVPAGKPEADIRAGRHPASEAEWASDPGILPSLGLAFPFLQQGFSSPDCGTAFCSCCRLF